MLTEIETIEGGQKEWHRWDHLKIVGLFGLKLGLRINFVTIPKMNGLPLIWPEMSYSITSKYYKNLQKNLNLKCSF